MEESCCYSKTADLLKRRIKSHQANMYIMTGTDNEHKDVICSEIWDVIISVAIESLHKKTRLCH